MVNLGVLFREAKKGQLTDKQKNPTRSKIKGYKKGFRRSGLHRITKVKHHSYEQGFYFRYTYKYGKKQKTIQAKTIKGLYEKMKDRKLDFIVDDRKKAIKFFDENCNDEDYKFFMYNVLQGGDENES